MLAVIGLGSIGSMALWQASRLSDSVTGFEAAAPAHGRSSVGGDTRLLRMLYRGKPDYDPRSFEGLDFVRPERSAHDSRPSDSFLRLSKG
jgi:glycine/D-amino acid oxidase-like deaminating enzyme